MKIEYLYTGLLLAAFLGFTWYAVVLTYRGFHLHR